MRRWLPITVILAIVVSAGVVLAAEGPNVEILHDTGDDARTSAGTVNTFGWVLTNEDGEPAFHQDAVFEVTFNGQTVLRTPPSSGHDYDGIDPYQVAFPEPGTFTVRATTWDADEEVTATLTGQVDPAPETPAELSIEAPETVEAGEPVTITYEVTGPDGEPVEHADVTVRLRRAMDGYEILHTTTHAHDGEHAFTWSFDRTGTFELSLVATPVAAEGSPTVTPVAESATIEVTEDDPDPGVPMTSAERPINNSRERGSSDGPYELFGTYDPYTTIGPHGRVRLGAIALDADARTPVPNITYQASLTDPEGQQVFASQDLHQVDGFLEVTTSRPHLGTYHLQVHATKGDWSDTVTLAFTVLPPAGAPNSGPLFATPNATGQPEAGTPTQLPIYVRDGAHVPLLHGEVDWRVVGPDDVPVYTGKLHTHENGTFPLTVAFPSAGDYTVELMPQSLFPAPTPYTYGEAIGQAPVFDVSVADGPGLPSADEALDAASTDDETDETPAPGLIAVLGGLTVTALVRRREA